MAAIIALLILLGVAFVQDAMQSKIANALTLTGMLAGLVLSVATGDGSWGARLFHSVTGLLSGLTVMLVLYAIGAVGAGDVKLFGAIGAIAGVQFVLYGMMNAVLCAGIVGIVVLVWKREFRYRIRRVAAVLFGIWIWRDLRPIETLKSAEPLKFPFMYAVLPAMALTWWTIGI